MENDGQGEKMFEHLVSMTIPPHPLRIGAVS